MSTINFDQIRKYFASQPVEKAWLFGSFSRKEERNDSDIDLLVEFIPQIKIGMSYFKMVADLERISKRKVDLVEADMLDSMVRPFVEKDKILIYERAN